MVLPLLQTLSLQVDMFHIALTFIISVAAGQSLEQLFSMFPGMCSPSVNSSGGDKRSAVGTAEKRSAAGTCNLSPAHTPKMVSKANATLVSETVKDQIVPTASASGTPFYCGLSMISIADLHSSISFLGRKCKLCSLHKQ